jgi:hypothetical protein
MTDLAQVQLEAMLKPGVTLAAIPIALLRKIKRIVGIRQGTEETKDYLRESPPFTMKQCAFFRQCVDAMSTPKLQGYECFEDYGMSDPAGPKWSGSVCKAKGEYKEMVPIPHKPTIKQETKTDAWAASVASMMCVMTATDDVEVKCPETVASGPLSKLVTKLSLSTYELVVPPMFQGKIGGDRQPEKVAEAMYNVVADMSANEKNKLVDATYTLMAGLNVKMAPKGVSASKDFEIEWSNQPRPYTKESKTKTPIPLALGVPKTIKTKIDFVPRTVKIGKQTSAVVLNHYLQSFPPKLLEYFSFFGNPSKVQRNFMRLRPYLEVAIPLDPKDGIKKWLRAGGYAHYDSTDMYEANPDFLVLIKKDYSSTSRPKGAALYFGQVAFDSEFFTNYTIVMYHPPHKNQFFYVPNAHKAYVDILPPVWSSFNKKILTTDTTFTQALYSFSSLFCTCFMRGTYNPRPQQYEGLKYPLPKAGEYMTLDPESLPEDTTEGHVIEEDGENVVTFTYGDVDEAEDSEEEESVHAEELSGETDYTVHEFDNYPAYATEENTLSVPYSEYEELVKVDDKRLGIQVSFLVSYEGEKHAVCGVVKDGDEIVSVMLVPVPQPRLRKLPVSARSSLSKPEIKKPLKTPVPVDEDLESEEEPPTNQKAKIKTVVKLPTSAKSSVSKSEGIEGPDSEEDPPPKQASRRLKTVEKEDDDVGEEFHDYV